MNQQGFKLKCFKNIILGRRAVITYNHLSESLNGFTGTIQEGKRFHSFSIKFDSPVIFEESAINSLLLVESDDWIDD